MAEIILSIDARGTIQHLFSDELNLREIGPRVITRASHVEPDDEAGGETDGCWMVDLKPVGGPLVRGFRTRGDALFWEARWIEENVIQKPEASSAPRTHEPKQTITHAGLGID